MTFAEALGDLLLELKVFQNQLNRMLLQMDLEDFFK